MNKQSSTLGSKIKIASSAYIYVSVWTDECVSDMYVLETQETACRDFCGSKGWPVRGVFWDASVSGWKGITRPGLKNAMNALKKDPDANLVFYDYSRFGRKTLPALIAFDNLDRLGIYAVAVSDPTIDVRTSNGRIARTLAISTAGDFRCSVSENQTHDTFDKMLRNPVYTGKVESKHGVSKGSHVGLIPAEVLEDLQATLDGTRKPPTPSQSNREGFPLRKSLLCTCGTPLTRYSAKSGTGKVYRYYFCRKCRLRPVRGTEE